jgi:hypothetical protein
MEEMDEKMETVVMEEKMEMEEMEETLTYLRFFGP